jgi:hypothetical protein
VVEAREAHQVVVAEEVLVAEDAKKFNNLKNTCVYNLHGYFFEKK